MKKTLPICLNALEKEYSHQDIATALTDLIRKHYIIRGSTLSKDAILDNMVRDQIYKYVQVNPGAYNRLIRRELQIGSNEFNWHIGMLEKFGFLKTMLFKGRFGYFENRSFMDHEYDLFLMQNGKVKIILETLEKQPATVSQLAKKINMHWSTVNKYIKVLVEREFLKVLLQPKHKEMYEINQTLQIKLKKIINGAVFVQFA